MSPDPRARADALNATCAARLHGQRELAAFSLRLSAVAWAAVFAFLIIGRNAASWPIEAILIAAAVLGLVERYLAVRLAIDAQLFGDMASGSIADLRMLDQALAQLELAPAAKASRTLLERTAGALRLVRWHTRAVGLQLVLLTSAAAIAAGAAR